MDHEGVGSVELVYSGSCLIFVLKSYQNVLLGVVVELTGLFPVINCSIRSSISVVTLLTKGDEKLLLH